MKTVSMFKAIKYSKRQRIDLATAAGVLCGKVSKRAVSRQQNKQSKTSKTGEIMNSVLSLQPQRPQELNDTKAAIVPELQFTDNLAYVEFLVAEAHLWLALAYMRFKQIDELGKYPGKADFFKIPTGIKTRDDLAAYILEIVKNKEEAEKHTLANGVRLKFLELVEEYRLDELSRKVLQLVFVAETSMEFRAVFEECNIELWDTGMRRDLEVGIILSIICQDYREQMRCRSVFAIDQPLLKFEIIELAGRHVSFLQNDVTLHERISRFCLDDHNVYDTDLLCINSEWPIIKLSQVVLAEDLKADLIRYCESFLTNNRDGHGLSDSFGYGAGLTCLFYGLSGTGKTMLAHGLANHLGCQLFSVNIGGLQNADISFEDAMQYIFREARLAGGIVFLDECDDLLKDDSHMSRTFLIEIEKAECITILATNKTVKMDPAMDRRISLKIPFILPDETERLAIWRAILPKGMQYGDDVDLAELAGKYHFTGGLIKNTLLMAAGNAMSKTESRAGGEIISAKEIHKAARHQAKSMFDLGAIGKLLAPAGKLSELNIRRADLDKLAAVARLVPDMLQAKEGFCGLICTGNQRTGMECVRAVATEVGLVVRQFSMARLFDKNVNEKNRPLDPVTQQRTSMLEYVFAERPGQQEIVILKDDGMFMYEFLVKHRQEASLRPDWLRFKELIHDFSGILFVVTNPLAVQQVPIEFAWHLSLNYPAEDCQIRAWHTYFSSLSDQKLVELVEQFPMYIQEIDLVVRQSRIMARLEDMEQPDYDIIIDVARRLRKKKTMPFLFGAGE